MSLYGNIFGKRGKPVPDVYQYDTLPTALRAQIVHIIQDAIGPRFGDSSAPYFARQETVWDEIERLVSSEVGLLSLPRGRLGQDDPYTACRNYILHADPEKALAMVETCFRVINDEVRRAPHLGYQTRMGPDNAIRLLNLRFRENACGWQFEENQIVRVDSEYLHAEAVRPALIALASKGFTGPNKEFLDAHEHYRHGRIEASMNEALKSFESTLKAICTLQKWQFNPDRDTANTLIGIVLEKGLIPEYLRNHFSGFRAALEAGLPTVRNKESGHGKGAVPRDVPEHYAAYALHLAASNIVFLVECHKALH